MAAVEEAGGTVIVSGAADRGESEAAPAEPPVGLTTSGGAGRTAGKGRMGQGWTSWRQPPNNSLPA